MFQDRPPGRENILPGWASAKSYQRIRYSSRGRARFVRTPACVSLSTPTRPLWRVVFCGASMGSALRNNQRGAYRSAPFLHRPAAARNRRPSGWRLRFKAPTIPVLDVSRCSLSPVPRPASCTSGRPRASSPPRSRRSYGAKMTKEKQDGA